MTTEVFFFDIGGPLLCERIKQDGESIRAIVVNGGWFLRYEPGALSCYANTDADSLVNVVRCRIVERIPIPKEEDSPRLKRNYNDLIVWAEGKRVVR